jgi:hypothetical protein
MVRTNSNPGAYPTPLVLRRDPDRSPGVYGPSGLKSRAGAAEAGSFEIVTAAFHALMFEGVAVALFFACVFVWLVIGATEGFGQ